MGAIEEGEEDGDRIPEGRLEVEFGKGGFEQKVERVATIEKNLGIYDLAQFTPNA